MGHIDLWGLQGYSVITGAAQAEALHPDRAKGLTRRAVEYNKSEGQLGAGIAAVLSPVDEVSIGVGLMSKTALGRGILNGLGKAGSSIVRFFKGKGKNIDNGIGAGGRGVDNFSDDLVSSVNESGGLENSSSCAEAVNARLDGDLSAVANVDAAVDIYGVNSRFASKFGSPSVTTTKFGDIANTLDGLGDGAKGIVTASGNPGHAFNIARLNGKVKILDGQSGQIISRDQFRGYLSQFPNSTYRFFDTTN